MRSRRSGGALTAVALALVLAPAPADAGSLDTCAERVLRDWYTGGRIDKVYPLACYRAALGAMPTDVLQYSTADQDIRRALAYARRGRSDPGGAPAAKADPTTGHRAGSERTQAPADAAPPATPSPAPIAAEAAAPARSTPIVAETRPGRPSPPYPILALTALAAVLLAAGAIEWHRGRRRRPGLSEDR